MRWLLLMGSLLLSVSCSSLNPLSFLGGGGPTVNSNAQIGKENRQSVVSYEKKSSAGRDVVTTTKEVEAGPVEELQINNTNIPPWVMLLLLLGWLLPTPNQIANSFYRLISKPFRRKSVDKRFD